MHVWVENQDDQILKYSDLWTFWRVYLCLIEFFLRFHMMKWFTKHFLYSLDSLEFFMLHYNQKNGSYQGVIHKLCWYQSVIPPPKFGHRWWMPPKVRLVMWLTALYPNILFTMAKNDFITRFAYMINYILIT